MTRITPNQETKRRSICIHGPGGDAAAMRIRATSGDPQECVGAISSRIAFFGLVGLFLVWLAVR